MKYYLGIDGGGTKTAYLLVDEQGRTMASFETKGCSYKEDGIEAVVSLLAKGVDCCLAKAGVNLTKLVGIVLGLPCFGEDKKEDNRIKNMVEEVFHPILIYITNDVEVGWAGSLGLSFGINVVAGTGSIAFGKNQKGKQARSGGWSTFFGDEGSCYWLGRRTMELFSKEADGRMPKGSLFDVIMEEYHLEDPMDFVTKMEKEYMPERSKVASMQRYLLLAAQKGDKQACKLYKEAAEELGLMVESLVNQLELEDTKFQVSYSGGLFHAKEYVLPYLGEMVKELGGVLTKPQFLPVEGAALLAIQLFDARVKMSNNASLPPTS